MPQPRRSVPALLLAWMLLPVVARAQAPVLGDPTLAFPGAFPSPPDAVSAARGMADAWLGETPWSNPAAPIARRAALSVFALHVGRQDLRADNRNYDEVGVFPGGAGAAVGLPVGGRLALWAYASRPESRFEENTYSAGDGTDPSIQPALVTHRTESRETRAGAGISAALGSLRAGAAVELTARNDFQRRIERSGSPSSGTLELSFDGTAVGGQAGLQWSRGDTPRGRLELGAAVRFLPELGVSGEERDALATGTTVTALSATRESGWEGGVSAACSLSEAFRVMAGVGGRTAQRWDGFGVEAGAATHWAIAADLHDARDPWGLHVSAGRGTQDGVPEPSCSVVGLGGDWQFGTVRASVSVLRRGLHRGDAPTSYDDRFFAGLTASW